MNNFEKFLVNRLLEVQAPEEHAQEVFRKQFRKPDPHWHGSAKASDKAHTLRQKRLDALKFKRGQKIFGKIKDFNPGAR